MTIQEAIKSARLVAEKNILQSRDYWNLPISKEIFDPNKYKVIRGRLMKKDKNSWVFVDSNFERRMWQGYISGELKFESIIEEEKQSLNSQIIEICKKHFK